MGGDGETDRFQGFHRTFPGIVWVLFPFIFQVIHPVQGGLVEMGERRIVNQIPIPMALGQPLGADRILVAIEGVKHVNKRVFIIQHRFIPGNLQVSFRDVVGDITETGDLFRRLTLVQMGSQFQDAALSHAIEKIIGFGIKQHRPPDGV